MDNFLKGRAMRCWAIQAGAAILFCIAGLELLAAIWMIIVSLVLAKTADDWRELAKTWGDLFSPRGGVEDV